MSTEDGRHCGTCANKDEFGTCETECSAGPEFTGWVLKTGDDVLSQETLDEAGKMGLANTILLLHENKQLRKERDNWREEARVYCENANYWRERHEECGKKNAEIGTEMLKDKTRILDLEELLTDLLQEADHCPIGEVRAAINAVLQPNQ